jgi:hypothetical protein
VLILAGMPDHVSRAAQTKISYHFARWHVIHQPSPRKNDEMLYSEKLVSGLLEAVSNYAVRQQNAQPSSVTPNQILLGCVPAADEEHLLQAFDFFVFPVRLIKLAEYDASCGQQYRHSQEFALEYLVKTLEAAIRSFGPLKARLSTPGSREPFFLPPVIFMSLKKPWSASGF